MNAKRRKDIEEIKTAITDCKANLEALRDEEQEYRDNMAENLACGESGDKADAVIEALDEAVNNLDEAQSSLDTATE